jgi:putative two-component system response regulator
MPILVVDDNEVDRVVAQRVLERFGYEVVTAENGLKAINIIQRQDIHIVISDWNMPQIDGIDLCKQIRSGLAVGYIYIILVTARNSREDLVAALSAGADDFISKPFDSNELRVRLKNAERILLLETSVMTIFSLAKLAESRDPETGHHLERIREYSRVLTEELLTEKEREPMLTPKYAELIFQTSPLHDIGKVGIPDHILLKQGSLTDEEFAIMKQHTVIGGKTLEETMTFYPGAEFLHQARDIALSHHEQYDGSGYPRGLKGREIPLCARIVALADVYDALTMKRVYKAAYSHEIARDIIYQGKGRHFDPKVVEAFERKDRIFRDIREAFPE